MEWVIIGVNVVGFLIVGYYLKRKNDTLLAEIQSQKSILDSVKVWMDIFDLEKVRDYVQIIERKTQYEKEEDIKK